MAEALPRAPFLGWSSLAPSAGQLPPGVLDLPSRRLTTSGRAALLQALQLCAATPGSGVLVPTYHCPTLVAPVVSLGLVPLFYAIDEQGLPALQRLPNGAERARAMIVPHYFGRGASLAAVRAWCDHQGVVLIEDCAHTLYGMAGNRPVGQWGDYATASLSKFLPVPEAGLLASGRRPLPTLDLQPPGFRREVKAVVDMIERRPARGLMGRLATWRRRRSAGGSVDASSAGSPPSVEAMMDACDMGRTDQRPTQLALWLAAVTSQPRAVSRRRRNFDRLLGRLRLVPGLQPLWPERAESVPYVLPVRVEDPDALYARARQAGLAVLRWDRVWPGTPRLGGDCGSDWSTHVLQFLCHQDLRDQDIDRTADAVERFVSEGRV